MMIGYVLSDTIRKCYANVYHRMWIGSGAWASFECFNTSNHLITVNKGKQCKNHRQKRMTMFSSNKRRERIKTKNIKDNGKSENGIPIPIPNYES